MKKTLRPYQSAALDEVSRHFSEGRKRVILCSPVGSGKCLGFGTPVLMFDGTIKTVENVVVGDLLMGPDSAPRRVKSVCTGSEELFRVTPIKGDSYVVNRSHILSLKTTPSMKGEEVVTKNVPVTEWLSSTKWFKSIHKGWRAAVDFDARPTHPAIQPYFLGLWLGDGSAERPSVSKPDPEILEYMGSIADGLGTNISSNTSKSCPTISIVRKTNFESNRLLDALRELNVTSNKHVPMMYKANSREVRLEVLAGLMDSDGSLSNSGYEFISKHEQLADDVCFLARSLGLAAYKTPCKKTCTNNGVTGDYFRVCISGKCDMIPCKIARKKCPPREQKKSVLVTGINLSSMGVGDYYGFEIEGNDRLFLLGDFTVTHNTFTGANSVLRAVERGKKVLWVAHRSELVDQAAAALASVTGRRIGIIQGSRKPDPSALIQVATIQTLIRRENIPPADLIVGDEAHRMLAKQWHALLETYSKSYFLYLTATPERGDGKPMGDLADVIVPTVQPSELIDEGVLVPCEIIAPNAEIAKGLAEDPVTAYLQWGGRRRAVFFCQTKEHARRVTESLEANGITAGMVTDDTPWATRKVIYKKVYSGQILALVNVFVATEGLDIPPLEVCVIARTMGHASMMIQAVGRVMRSSPGKSSGLIIDLKGVVEKYGSPEADRHYHLEGEEAVTIDDKGAAKRLKCPDCGSLRSGPVCQVCGLAFGCDRPPVPDIVSTPLEVKVAIDRTDAAAAEYIRIVHDKFAKKVKNFAREASIAFRQSRNSPPASDWITLYADFLRGHLTPSRRPSWWPDDVEISLYRRTQHDAAE